VGQKKPNDLGLFDMLGNAYEWCQDPYRPYKDADDARGEPILDAVPGGPVSPSIDRVLRGGTFLTAVSAQRCVTRAMRRPSNAGTPFGLRVARTCP
jgi:formylglycine-generating enzyme required for sulfatase activity